MIPIVLVLVYKLEKCIQHIINKEILSYLQKQLMVKKLTWSKRKMLLAVLFLLVKLNGLKLV